MCENKQKPELDSDPCKKEHRSHTDQNQELGIWRHVHGKKSSITGAVSFLRRLCSLEIIHPVPRHTYNPD